MHLFEVIALDVESVPPVPVFAESYDFAVCEYVVWWMSHRDGELPDLEVRKRNLNWPGLDAERLAEALSLGISGIGTFDSVAGWMIHQFGDEDSGL